MAVARDVLTWLCRQAKRDKEAASRDQQSSRVLLELKAERAEDMDGVLSALHAGAYERMVVVGMWVLK